MKLLGLYKNGNYRVRLYDNGIKVKETIDPKDTKFISEFPESIDLKITNKCDMNCKMCHENSSVNGAHGDIDLDFIKTIPPYTEVAIGGGNPLEHPGLLHLLHMLKNNNVIVNMTVNQTHFMKYDVIIMNLLKNKLIHGLGISYNCYDEHFFKKIKNQKNVVLHIIAGLIDLTDLKKLYDKDLKILILGYKKFRKGNDLYSNKNYRRVIDSNILNLKYNLDEIVNHFKVVSFDNLAIDQLKVANILSPEQWDIFYQGDDGSHTFYIDMVNKEFARNSTSLERYPLMSNVTDMFQKLKYCV